MEDMPMKGTKGRNGMTTTTKEDADQDRRLTKTQLEIRARCGNTPRHIRRSIDAYRVARGMPPLWGSSLERSGRL